jgi:Cu-processing system ATP-binding protein
MISYRSFTKRFGRQRAVESLTLDVARGEVVALLGPNGSGKTTTLKAAAGLILPTSGTVTLGDPPRPAHEPAARHGLSYLPQKVSFPDALTGSEVVEFYRELRGAARERSQAVLRFAALNGAGERQVGTYSGGMVQRLGLAVAMLPEAPAVLLDEPTAALDPDGLCAFYGLVEHAREDGRAVLFTSHQLGDAERLADRFAVLVGGRLVASLTASELKDRLSERGVMRLRLAARPAGLLAAVRIVAPGATWAAEPRERPSGRDEELIVPGPASVRPRVLDAVRGLGAEVRGLTADEGRLDVLYRELVGEAEARAGHEEAGT